MRFHANNRLTACQDHLCLFYTQIPPGVDFRVSKRSYGWHLAGHGYGCRAYSPECVGHCYGNGSLTVFASDTPKRWRLKLDAAAAAEER